MTEKIKSKYEKGKYRSYIEAFEGGYSLASEQLTAAEARIKELEEGLKNLRHGTFMNIAAVNSYIDQLLNK